MRSALMIFIGLISSPVLAMKDQAEINRWVQKQSDSLLGGCEKINHAEWFHRYDHAEDETLDQLEHLGIELRKIPREDSFRKWLQVIFPQDLPKDYPLRGGFLVCIETFHDFKNANGTMGRKKTTEKLEECFQSSYRLQRPAILDLYLNCLKKLN